jgi:hypothetical protein
LSQTPNRLPNVPLSLDQRQAANAINYLLARIDDLGTGGVWVPLVTGAEPPELVSDGAGSLIFVSWSPE